MQRARTQNPMNPAAMPIATPRQPHHPGHRGPDEVTPSSLPVEPDQGPVPALIPDDPEQERMVDPEV